MKLDGVFEATVLFASHGQDLQRQRVFETVGEGRPAERSGLVDPLSAHGVGDGLQTSRIGLLITGAVG